MWMTQQGVNKTLIFVDEAGKYIIHTFFVKVQCWPKLNEPPLKNDKKCFINQNTHMFQLIQYKLSHQMIFLIIVCFTI